MTFNPDLRRTQFIAAIIKFLIVFFLWDVCLHVSVCTCMYIYVYILYIYIYICNIVIYVCIYIYVYIYMCVCVCVCVCMYLYIYHVCILNCFLVKSINIIFRSVAEREYSTRNKLLVKAFINVFIKYIYIR